MRAAYTAELGRVGNPSSLHGSGQAARRRLEEARAQLAQALGAATPSEVVFTSGGTEADNLALKGLFWARAARDAARTRILLSTVEHHAVMETAEWLEEHEGAELVWIGVDADGVLDLAQLRAALADAPERVALVSVMAANNEVGALQPIREVVEAAHAHGVPVHTDAVQALGQVPLSFAELGVDAMSVSAHKIGGPVGVGALLLARDAAVVPVQHGGGQERSVRSGTLDVAGAVAFAAAATAAVAALPQESARIAAMRDRLIAGLGRAIPEARLMGPTGEGRLPGNVHLVFPGCEGDSLLFLLDSAGIESSTGSACQAGVSRPSHVVLAMGYDEDTARSTQRFTLGHTTSEADIDLLLQVLPQVWERANAAGMVSATPAWKINEYGLTGAS